MIQEKIFKYFEGNSDLHVLFIFDQAGFIEAEISDCNWPDGYRFVSFAGDWFTVKYKLANDWKNDKVILLFKGSVVPDKQDENTVFPLYGEMKANMVYSEEDYLTFMQLKGIPASFGPFIAKHIAELQLSKYDRILSDSYQPGVFSVDLCNRGLLSGYMGSSKILSWDDIIIRLVCMDAKDADKDKLTSFFRALKNNADGSKALSDAMSSITGVSFDLTAPHKLGRFAESFKYNAITQAIPAINADDYKSYRINNSIMLQKLNSFMETAFTHPVYAASFADAIDTLASNIHEDKIISWYGPDAEYSLVTKALSWPIIDYILKNSATSDPVKSNEKLRAFSLRLPKESKVQEVIDFLSNACFLLEKMGALGTFKLGTPSDYIKMYTTEFYLVDSYYRLCVGEFRDIPITVPVYNSLSSFKKYLDEEYSKKVNLFNQEWLRCVKELSVKPIDLEGVLHQQEFYAKRLKGNDAKRVVIVSDALRYEVAVDLLSNLGDARHDASIEPALAILPTETKYSKLALLPHQSLRYDNATLYVDNETLESTDKRTAQLKRFESDALCIDFDELANYSQTQKREIFKNKLVYIFHNTIDSMSHDNPSKLSIACRAAVDELKKLIPSLHATYNVANVYVTSDHGFLYNDIPFEDKDKHKVNDTYEERKTRYYITDDDKDVFGITKFNMADVSSMTSGGKIIAVPNGSNRFNAEGGGYQFAHGGATLQEMIIPVIYSHLRRTDNKQAVELALLSTALTMVSSRLKFSIIQSEPISEDFKERHIVCGIYEGNTLLTAEKELVLNSTDPNPQNRFYNIELTLNQPTQGGILELRIYDAEDKGRLNPLKKAIVTNKTLIDKDF